MECYEKYNVTAHQEHVGSKVREIWQEVANKYNVKIHIFGILPLIHFCFEYENTLAYKTYFTQEMLAEGFLAANGVYASLAHTDDVLKKYKDACDKVFSKIGDIVQSGKNVEDYLRGPVCHSGFSRLN